MTPVKNEAWILNAFLKVTSIWADYIIIADQNSIDNSREIALQFPKVILIENKSDKYNESSRQELLINRARQIKGDKILFALDADEIFSANFIETNDWHKILNSVPGDVFWFKWANIFSDKKHYWESKNHFPWVFHDDGNEPHKNYAKNMHSMRIPYPIHEKQMYYVNDFKVLHLAYLSPKRTIAKLKFYQIIDYQLNKRNSIVLSRSYQQPQTKGLIYKLPKDWVYTQKVHLFDLFEEINLSEMNLWYYDNITEIFEKEGINKFLKINIWDKELNYHLNCDDNRPLIRKIIHKYLNKTDKISNNLIIKLIDKLLKKIID